MIVVLILHLILSDILLWHHSFHDSCTYSSPHLLIFCSGTILSMIVVLILHLILSDILLWYHSFHDSCTYSSPHLVSCFALVPFFPWYLYLFFTSSCLIFCSGIILSMIVVLILHLILSDILLWHHSFHDSCPYSSPHLVWYFALVPFFPW